VASYFCLFCLFSLSIYCVVSSFIPPRRVSSIPIWCQHDQHNTMGSALSKTLGSGLSMGGWLLQTLVFAVVSLAAARLFHTIIRNVRNYRVSEHSANMALPFMSVSSLLTPHPLRPIRCTAASTDASYRLNCPSDGRWGLTASKSSGSPTRTAVSSPSSAPSPRTTSRGTTCVSICSSDLVHTTSCTQPT
jgi:hypothetical protein